MNSEKKSANYFRSVRFSVTLHTKTSAHARRTRHSGVHNRLSATALRRHHRILRRRTPRPPLPHPATPLQLLTTPHEKAGLLGETLADDVAMLPFTRELAALSARAFMTDILRSRFNVRVLVIGYDHRFGHGRAEGFDDYVRIGHEIGMEVVQARELDGGQHVSSSSIRRALQEGRVEDAAAMLGRPYTLGGTVVPGHHVGTALGFPTANLRPDDPDKLVPMNGAYGVEVCIGTGRVVQGMLNIGTRPTLDNGTDRSIEVHLFDFHEDIYEQHMEIHFLRFIRNEKKFATVDELQKQLQHDERACRQLISNYYLTIMLRKLQKRWTTYGL